MQLSKFGEEIFKLRYAVKNDETFDDACLRVARDIAKIEKYDQIDKYSEEFYNILSNNLFSCGGRIWRNAGRPKANLLNCFVVPVEDSREGWGQLISDFIVISGNDGGVGINFSPIRPRGSIIKTNGGEASGPVSLMEIVDTAGAVIKGGGNRRAAAMFALRYNHPDIMEFLNKKLDLKQLTNANISVIIDQKFIDAVNNNEDIETEFGGIKGPRYNSKELFNRLVDNSILMGEPGIINLGLANHFNNVNYSTKLICYNPCGELGLSAYGSCDLGSLVLPTFVSDSGEFNWQLLSETISSAVRFLDNVLDVNSYPLDIIEKETKKYRRLGLGIMGLHDMLLKMNLKYDSQGGLDFVDKVMGFIKKKAYEASTYLAAEKGQFPEFDKECFLKSNFIKTLSPSLKTKIAQHGMRNSALMTIAPTGTTSIVAGCSGGIEPIYATAYSRRYRDSTDLIQAKVVVHPLFSKFIKEKRDVSHFQGAMDISPESHLKMQQTCQYHLDGNVSKTINLPKDFSDDSLKELLLKYLPSLKGITIYKDGSRGVSPLTPLSIEEAIERVNEDCVEEIMEHKCNSGNCTL